MNKTYRELKEFLDTFNDEELDSTASIYLLFTDEVIPVSDFKKLNEENDIYEIIGTLDDGHPIIYVIF